MESFRELLVWQKSMDLAQEIYSIVKFFPNEEIYSLTSQVRRCVVSIPSNIAEGYGRQSLLEYIRFLRISRGSLNELQTQLELAFRFNYINENNLQNLMDKTNEIGRMLNSLISKLEAKK